MLGRPRTGQAATLNYDCGELVWKMPLAEQAMNK